MIPEWERPSDWNEDDEFMAEAMEAVIEQGCDSEFELSSEEIIRAALTLLARIAVETGAMRQILDSRLPPRRDKKEPWEK